MEKRISVTEFQSAKRVAQACNPLMMKREAVKAKIEKLIDEYQSYDTQIKALEAGIVQVIGCRVEELVKKVIEPGTDVNGLPKKTTKYLPTSIVTYDADKKQYVITLPDPGNDNSCCCPPEEPETAEEPVEQTVPVQEEDPLNDPLY